MTCTASRSTAPRPPAARIGIGPAAAAPFARTGARSTRLRWSTLRARQPITPALLKSAALLAGAVLVAASARTARADIGRLGTEFQVNTYTSYSQNRPAVAADGAGTFVVVWHGGPYSGPGPDGDDRGVFGQRFDSAGAPIAGEFQVNTFSPGQQRYPAASMTPLGDFVVVWESGAYSVPGPDGSQQGIAGRRFNATGAPLGGEFQVNTYTAAQQTRPAVAHDGAGNFVVVWESGSYYGAGPDGSEKGIFAQRYDSSGARVGAELQVNTYTSGEQRRPAVAADAAGNFVVVWQSGTYYSTQDGDYSGVFGQRFASGGTRIGTEFRVNTYTPGYQEEPRVAADAAGGFVVVWRSSPSFGAGQDGSSGGVFGQRFGSSGAVIGGEFQVNTYWTGVQRSPVLAIDPQAGTFVVVWRSGYYYGSTQDGDGEGVFSQHFDSAGAPIGPELQVNTYTTDEQRWPAVAADGTGRFVIAWESVGYTGQDGFGGGVFGQRFAVTATKPPVSVSGARLMLKDDPSDPARRAIVVRSTDSAVALGEATPAPTTRRSRAAGCVCTAAGSITRTSCRRPTGSTAARPATTSATGTAIGSSSRGRSARC